MEEEVRNHKSQSLRVEFGGDPSGAWRLAQLVLLFADSGRSAGRGIRRSRGIARAVTSLPDNSRSGAARPCFLPGLQAAEGRVRPGKELRDWNQPNTTAGAALDHHRDRAGSADHRRLEQLDHLLVALTVKAKGVLR